MKWLHRVNVALLCVAVFLVTLLWVSTCQAQTYTVTVNINPAGLDPSGAMTFTGTFTYFGGILENVNVSNPYSGGPLTDGFQAGNDQVTLDNGKIFLSFYIEGGTLGSNSTSFYPYNITLNTAGVDTDNEAGAVDQDGGFTPPEPNELTCGTGTVVCSASLYDPVTTPPPPPPPPPVTPASGGKGSVTWIECLTMFLTMTMMKLCHRISTKRASFGTT